MARYRFSIDLGAYIGARYINFTEGEGKKVIPGIFIPAGINGIEVKQDNRQEGKGNGSGFRAFLNFQQRPVNYKLIDSIKQRLVSQGEIPSAYNVPAYDVCYVLPEEKRKAIRKNLAKAVLIAHPEWKDQPDEKGTDLARAISTMMPFSIGISYLMEDQHSASPMASSNAPVAQGVAGYTPATPAPADANGSDPYAEDPDLPF